MKNISRRQFLELCALFGISTISPFIPKDADAVLDFLKPTPLAEILKPENYKERTKDWDPIFGPPIASIKAYGGKADFQGHQQYPTGGTPGIDYAVPMQTPIVLGHAGTLWVPPGVYNYAGLTISAHPYMSPPGRLFMNYSHLDEVLVDKQYILHENTKRSKVGMVKRNDIVFLAGISGEHSAGPHLHWCLWDNKHRNNDIKGALDPAKHGPDGGPPVFWNCRYVFDMSAEGRFNSLKWWMNKMFPQACSKLTAPDSEFAGRLLEYKNRIGDKDSKAIFESPHFHDLKKFLKEEVLVKRKHLPGSVGYSLMLGTLGYGTDPSQEIVLTLPFISPLLLDRYKVPVFGDGLVILNPDLVYDGQCTYKGEPVPSKPYRWNAKHFL